MDTSPVAVSPAPGLEVPVSEPKSPKLVPADPVRFAVGVAARQAAGQDPPPPARTPQEVWVGPEATSVEELFDRAAAYIEDQEGWEPVGVPGPEEGPKSFVKPVTKDVSFFLTDVNLPLSFADWRRLLNPEVFYDPLRAEFDTTMEDCQVLQLFAPGDALVSMRLASHPMMLKWSSLVGKPACTRAEEGHLLRVARRRDFPRPGMWCYVQACMNQETMMICEGEGSAHTTVMIMQEAGDAVHCREIIRLHRVPAWALDKMPNAADFVAQWVAAFRGSRLCAVLEAEEGLREYMVLALRKCERGPPLMPVSFEEDTWAPCDREFFSVSQYLQMFAEKAGVDLLVYDSMDGQHVVPYQAVVSRAGWHQAEAQFMDYFRLQRAAYRRIFGGSAAPVIKADVEARFVPVQRWKELQQQTYGGRVAGTFLDFRETSGSRSRCGSAH
mmetsp:Transcript_59435/g.137329  ORF Transcript_59435/g.137329 Transcript_59435/m.137329 type:complete len:441 (+) Transcript_59435:36-1358(+)